MTDTTHTRDPADIERDIRRTQNDISRTVDQIGDQLTPRSILNALLDKAESNDIDARTLLDGARRNPLALAMLAGGAIWLVSDSDAKLPTGALHRSKRRQPEETTDQYHRDYVAHMERVELRDGEDPLAYQRRRDIARANFLMCERGHDEDESSYRKRLDDMTEKFRQKRHAWSDQAGRAAGSASDSARSAASRVRGAAQGAGARAQDIFAGNPLVGGLAAAAVGAILGTVIPLTETEDEQLRDVGDKARGLASEQKDKLTQQAKGKKDELVGKAEEMASDHSSSGGQGRSGDGASGRTQANDSGYEPTLQQAASQGPLGQPGASQTSPAQPNSGSTSDRQNR